MGGGGGKKVGGRFLRPHNVQRPGRSHKNSCLGREGGEDAKTGGGNVIPRNSAKDDRGLMNGAECLESVKGGERRKGKDMTCHK